MIQQMMNMIMALFFGRVMLNDIPHMLDGYSSNPKRYARGQVVTIEPNIAYGWRAWVTVERDDPENEQVWVKELPRAVKYEHIEEPDED